MLAERERLVLHLPVRADELDLGNSVGQLQRSLQRISESPLDAIAANQAIDNDLDAVLFVARQLLVALQELGDVDDFSVDPCAHETLRRKVFQQRAVFTLAAAHHGSEHLEASAIGKQQNAIDDLRRSLSLQPGTVRSTVLNTHTGVQQSQVVVDLGDGAHRGTRVAASALLVDGDRRRQAFDGVDIGLIHLAKELTGVRAERLHITTLALGVDRVERKAALTGTGQTGEHDQPIAGQFDADVLQVVLASSSDDDLGFRNRRHVREATEHIRSPSGKRPRPGVPFGRVRRTSAGAQPASRSSRRSSLTSSRRRAAYSNFSSAAASCISSSNV
ncbi:unannotated protein [freshwater metagenome]|uniref:Unannotated protein n=1 Tax=freshwater metagenome TaxID=449393 RepID=A0A6J7ATV5_9ZZZZ